MTNLLQGLLFMFVAQIGTFIQLNVSAKYNWFEKYPIQILLFSVPISWLYIISVKKLIQSFEGELWPQRILGFGVGIIVFAAMSYIFFKEPITLKTIICLILSCIIILIQILF